MSLTLINPSGSDVLAALRAARHGGATFAHTLAFTLVVDALAQGAEHLVQFEDDAIQAARSHPCRIILLSRRLDRPVDGDEPVEVEVTGTEGAGSVEMIRVSVPSLDAVRVESVLRPLLGSDVPVVCWWPCGTPTAVQLAMMRNVSSRRIFDSTYADDAINALQTVSMNYAPGDTDLAWARLSPLRGVLASLLEGDDEPTIVSVVITLGDRPSGGFLLGSWLAHTTGARIEYVYGSTAGAPERRVDVVLRSTAGEERDVQLTTEEDRYVQVVHDDGRTLNYVGPLMTQRLLLARELANLGEDVVFRGTLADLRTS